MSLNLRPLVEDKTIHTSVGAIHIRYTGSWGSLQPCSGHGSYPGHRCKNRARFFVEGRWMCQRHVQVWAIQALVGRENLPSLCAGGGRAGDHHK